MTRATRLAAAVLAHAVATAGLAAQQDASVTPRVFSRVADRVVRIQVVESASAAKVGVGSGFFIGDGSRLVTNYHVVADLVHHPARYRAELGDGSTPDDTATILDIDVVHDLAVLRTARRRPAAFALGDVTVEQGDRLYALGHPNDLGLSIVEGTHNGLLKHTLYPKLHFTGSLNPGMSGGPTITADGRVVGVNVSTAGNQVSFLVPVGRVIALVAGLDSGRAAPGPLLNRVASQITEYQDAYLGGLLGADTRHVDLGPFRVVTEPAPFFQCWGDVSRETDLPYREAEHRCSTDDQVYVAENQQSGVVSLSHELVTTDVLGPARFFALYSSVYQRDNTPGGHEEHVTRWQCETRSVRPESVPVRATLCVRAYRKLRGLYDAVLKVAVLGHRDAGLVSTLSLSGVSGANIRRLTTRYLEQFAWP